MASVGTIYPSSTTAASSTSSPAASTSSTSSSNSLANQTTFLQLLVAQLQYQDPTQPMDGTTFVTQLATFSDLQANLGSKTDLDAISKQYLNTASTTGSSASGASDPATGTAASGSTTSGTGTTTGTVPSVTGS